MAKFCNSCGKEIEPGVKFCGSCGAPVTDAGAIDDAVAGVDAGAAADGAPPAEDAGGYADTGTSAGASADEAPPPAGTATGADAKTPSGGSNDIQQKVQAFIDKVVAMAQNTPDHTAEYNAEDISKNKTMACVAYIPILFFVPLVASPESKFGRFHANQGLILLLGFVAMEIVRNFLYWILKITWILSWLRPIVGLVFYVVFLAYIFIGIMNTNSGKAKELPIIGKISIIK